MNISIGLASLLNIYQTIKLDFSLALKIGIQ